jgi:ubiquinone/menaquinone biosynthesis C-methylase UbiE
MRLIQALLRRFYYLLYHQFAWSYDIVSTTVSLGHWREWVGTALPHLKGRVLEIGFGPGHLQVNLIRKNILAFGIDESRQMVRQAARRLLKNEGVIRISCGYAQFIPFISETFNSVVATFPSEFIFDPQTLLEIRRVLLPGGDLVIIPTAWITGGHQVERLAAWVFRVTGEAPGKPHDLSVPTKNRINQAGFLVKSEVVETKGNQVLLIVATKT